MPTATITFRNDPKFPRSISTPARFGRTKLLRGQAIKGNFDPDMITWAKLKADNGRPMLTVVVHKPAKSVPGGKGKPSFSPPSLATAGPSQPPEDEYTALIAESKQGKPTNRGLVEFAEKYGIDLSAGSQKSEYMDIIEHYLETGEQWPSEENREDEPEDEPEDELEDDDD